MNIPKKIPPCKSCLVQPICKQPCHDLYIYHCNRHKKLTKLNSLVPGIASIICPVVYLLSWFFELSDRNMFFVTVIGIGVVGFVGITLQAKFFIPRIRTSDHVMFLWETEYVNH